MLHATMQPHALRQQQKTRTNKLLSLDTKHLSMDIERYYGNWLSLYGLIINQIYLKTRRIDGYLPGQSAGQVKPKYHKPISRKIYGLIGSRQEVI